MSDRVSPRVLEKFSGTVRPRLARRTPLAGRVCVPLQATLMLNEVFDIDLSLDSWWFLPDKAMPKKIRDVPKQLLFNAPVRGR